MKSPTRKLVLVLSVAFLGISTYYALFTLDGAAKYLNEIIGRPEYMLFIAGVLIAATLLVLFSYIDKCSKKMLRILKILFVSILIVGQLIIVFSFDVLQITDAYLIRDQALAIVEGIDQTIDYESTWYFVRYGNNNFVLVLTVWVYKLLDLLNISNDNLVFALLNTVLIDLAIYMLYKTVKELTKERLAEKVLVLCVINPMNYLLIHWTYTCTYSIPIGVAIIYIATVIYKRNCQLWKKCCLAGTLGLLITVGYFLRPTALIPFIAVIFCFFMFKENKKKSNTNYLLMILCLVIALTCGFFGLKKINAQYEDETVQNFPITHWVMMGLSEEGIVNTPDNMFTSQFETTEEKTAANIEEIKNRVQEYGFSGLVNHAMKKLALTWSDGVSEYYSRFAQEKEYSGLYQWMAGEKKDFVILYCQCFRIITLLFATYSVWSQWKNKEKRFLFLFTLTLLGGMTFYIIWEGKSVYSVPFLPFLCVLSADGLEKGQRAKIRVEKKK